MRVNDAQRSSGLGARIRARLAGEAGYTMVIALGVLVVTSLLVGSAYTAVSSDAPLTQRDLESKRAYYAARAGVNRFLYELNNNPNLWQTCPTVATKTAIAPGSSQKYTYKPVPANGASACSPSPPASGDPISTLIDTDSGTFRMQFTGYAGTPEVQRGLIVSFRKDTPLDYLWFTIYETLDPATYPVPANFADCNTWERPPFNRDSKCRDIRFITGDDLNGPTYTQDQYLIDGSPNFGRSGTNDKTESTVEETDPASVCMHWDTQGAAACETATFRGTRAPSAPTISPPPSSDQLLLDAQRYGCGSAGCGTPGNPPGVQTGITKIVLNGTSMQITNCQVTCGAVQNVTINKFPNGTPIVYVKNASGCDPTYTPYNPTYPATGPCGTVYVHGTYNRSLTIASQSDIIVDGPIIKSGGAPAPVLGLTANNFVRVMHGIGGRPAGADQGDCGSNTILDGNPSGEPDQTLTDLQIDAAILAIKHSFIVDNFDCGTHSSVGELTVNGAIAQTFRGTVGTGSPSTGYLKDYNYDNRFEVAQPPYLFNIASSSWRVERETLCVPGGTAPSTAC
jgi:hypothetical protein